MLPSLYTAPLALLLAVSGAVPAAAQSLDCTLCGIPTAPPVTPPPQVARARSANAVTVVAVSLKGLLKKGRDGLSVFLTRVDGFMIDRRRGDVILIAEMSRAAPLSDPFDMRDVAEALKAAESGSSPSCSLDPLPGNAVGPQIIRVDGVPRDSHFARVMLDADYLMKRTAVGESGRIPMPSATDRAINYYSADCERVRNVPAMTRFWFHALAPRSGDVLTSSSGSVYWVKSRVGVETEGMRAAGGSWASAPRRDPPAEDFAADLTRRFPSLVGSQPLFERLKGLYQEVYVASLIRAKADGAALDAASAWADAWRGPRDGSPGPYRAMSYDVRLQCPGANDYMITVTGGVETEPPDLSAETATPLDGLERDVAEAVAAKPDEAAWTLEYAVPPSYVEAP